MKRYLSGYRKVLTIIQSGASGKEPGFIGFYMAAPDYFERDVDYSGFFLHYCLHNMDLASHLVSPELHLHNRKIESTSGRLLFHEYLNFYPGRLAPLRWARCSSAGAHRTNRNHE